MPEFYGIFAGKIPFPRVLGQFPALKLRVSGFRTNTNYVIIAGIVRRAQSC